MQQKQALPLQTPYTCQDIDARATTWQKRGMRLSNVFHEVVFALKDDLMTHPWKFLFYATPIPPGASTLMLIGTLAYIAFGRTNRIKGYREKIGHSLNGPLHYERYHYFMTENTKHTVKITDPGAPRPTANNNEAADNDAKTIDAPSLRVAWRKFAVERWFQTRRYLLEQSVLWSNDLPNNAGSRTFRKTLNWDIGRMKKGSHGYLFDDLPAFKPLPA